jgi:hypothetical protein
MGVGVTVKQTELTPGLATSCIVVQVGTKAGVDALTVHNQPTSRPLVVQNPSYAWLVCSVKT